MAKGRNSWLITLRLPDGIRDELDTRALKAGESIGQYLQSYIICSVHAKSPTSEAPIKNTQEAKNGSVHTNKPTIPELQAMINQKQGHDSRKVIDDSAAPWYNSEVHTTGDTVKMIDPVTKDVKVVTL